MGYEDLTPEPQPILFTKLNNLYLASLNPLSLENA